jgi:hypothetical protein
MLPEGSRIVRFSLRTSERGLIWPPMEIGSP